MLRKLLKYLSPKPSNERLARPLWQQVENALPFLSYLAAEDRQALRQMALAFLDSKVFSGANGFEPSNAARLSIALQACLPVLKIGLSAYEGWSGIVVYPSEFVIPRREVDEAGVFHQYDDQVFGEAWHGGPVVLAWLEDPADYQGTNVVIHEFAHKLDMLNGDADGLPHLHADMSAPVWRSVLDQAYAAFCAQVERGEPTIVDPYGAEHPSEFFAVCSESFFTDPQGLHTSFAQVYEQFARFYRQDPGRLLA